MKKKIKSIRKRFLGLGKQLKQRLRPPAQERFKYMVKLAEAQSSHPAGATRISLVVPVFNARARFLRDLVASVRAQRRGSWELILADDGSTLPETVRWLDRHAADRDLTILRNGVNRGIASTTNAAIAAATAPWIGFLDHDDALAPHALALVCDTLTAHPDCLFLYTDEVIADDRLRPVDFFFKPAFDPVLLSGVNYTNHLSIFRRDRLLSLGMLREGFEGSQDYDLTLRYTAGLDRGACLHLPYPAYLWRRSESTFSARHVERAVESARRALADAYRGAGGPPPIAQAIDPTLHRVRFDAMPRSWPLVSIVIPNRDSFALISTVLSGLTNDTRYAAMEIIVVDNGTRDPDVLDLYARSAHGAVPFRALIHEEPFNFSRAINRGVAAARGDYVLLLNNDIEVLEPHWLEEMVSCFDYPDVGAVGAKLLYPDDTIQHAGVIVGFGGLAGHWFLNAPADFPGPMGRLWVRQSLSAVTGACLLVSREALSRVGPLDEVNFAIAYNDVDLCLRLLEIGKRVVWTPFAALRHHESASRGSDETPENIARFQFEQANLRARHRTDQYRDFAINAWYMDDRSTPEWRPLKHLPPAK